MKENQQFQIKNLRNYFFRRWKSKSELFIKDAQSLTQFREEKLKVAIEYKSYGSTVISFLMLTMIFPCNSESFEDYCPVRNQSATNLHFTRTLGSLDYALITTYKELHCCVEGATSIIWYKDGKFLKNSHWMYPIESLGNQTLIIKEVRTSNTGIYRCDATNETHNITHDIKFEVISRRNYTDHPLPIIIPQSQAKDLGESVSFQCEAFCGWQKDQQFYKSLDYVQSIYWTYLEANRSKKTMVSGIEVINYNRSNGDILGSELHIKYIRPYHFRSYKCNLIRKKRHEMSWTVELQHKGNSTVHKIEMYRYSILTVLIIIFLVAVIIFIYYRWRLEIRIYFKNRFGVLNQEGKDYDILLSCDCEDEEFREILTDKLEINFGYKCVVPQRDFPFGIYMDIHSEYMGLSRCYLVVLSPAFYHNLEIQYYLKLAIDAMINQKIKIICILYKTSTLFPEDTNLRKAVSVVRKIEWSKKQSKKRENKFWKQLQLHLPPLRTHQSRKSARISAISDEYMALTNNTKGPKEKHKQINIFTNDTHSKINDISNEENLNLMDLNRGDSGFCDSVI